MERIGFKMKLKSGCAQEYKKRHDNIWPELEKIIKETGVSDYSIFLDEETNTLFACQKISDGQGSQNLGSNPVVQRWWHYMADIMETNEDSYIPYSLLWSSGVCFSSWVCL
ncbi:MAG: L-rhamnose mutarotase [Spirochaetales bacterium]|nr:MAG: L-rhamnose mutarotase [Spirochaetales bacterium]